VSRFSEKSILYKWSRPPSFTLVHQNTANKIDEIALSVLLKMPSSLPTILQPY